MGGGDEAGGVVVEFEGGDGGDGEGVVPGDGAEDIFALASI